MSETEILEGKGPAPEPVNPEVESTPTVEAPATELQSAPRPRTRMIEAPTLDSKTEKERLQPTPSEVKVLRPASPARALARTVQPAPQPAKYPGFERLLGAARKVLPVVQKVLPLLEGNVPLTLANLLAPSLETPRRPVNLEPIEHALGKLHTEHLELRTQVSEQTAAIKLVAEQVAAVKQMAERNAQEREELAEDLRRLRKRVTVFAWVAFVLIAASLAANVVLILRVLR